MYEYSSMEMGQMLKIMAQNNIFANESRAFGNEMLFGRVGGRAGVLAQDELNCNQQLATFKGKKKPCPLSALGVAFPEAQMRAVGVCPLSAGLSSRSLTQTKLG